MSLRSEPESRPAERRARRAFLWGAAGGMRVEGSAGMRLFGAEKWQISGIGQEKTFRLPKRREPGYALIDFEIELRLSEGLARKSFFIEKKSVPAVVLL